MSTKVGEIYAELSIDDTRFTSALTTAEQRFGVLRTTAQQTAQQVDRSFQSTGATIERGGLGARNAAQDIGRIGDAAQDAARQVGRVGGAATDAARDVGRVERAADGAASATRRIEIPSGLASAAQRAADAVGSIGERASGAASTGSAMGDSFVGGFAGKLQGLAGKGGPIAAALVGVAGIGLAAGAVLASAIADGMEMEKHRDLVQARLGVNEATMAVIGAAAGAAFTNGWGESVQANMDTIGQVMQSGILSGEETAGEIQPVLEGLTAVTELMDEDMSKSIVAVRALMLNGLAPDAQTAMDLITRSFQKGGNVGEDLLDVIREYSNGWRNTGFSAEFTLGLINQSLENGADIGDRAGDSIREFGRRLYEEGDTIKESIGAINDEVEGMALPVDELFERLSKGGPDAEAAFDEIFDAIRQIEDPLKRNEVAMGLLGDTSGDFIFALSNWDPSKAAANMTDFAGSTEEAMRVMGDNAATNLDMAKRSITSSMDEVKLALGEAFGPTLSKVGTWVSEHKPEIMAFFVGLANGALACLDGLISFSSGALRAFAAMQEGIGDTVGAAITSLGGFAEKIGSVIKHIPGMGDAGKAIESAGSAAATYGTAMNNAADGAKALADQLDAARPTIQEIRDQVADAGATAVNAAEMTRLFGGTVSALPEGKALVIEALTADAKLRLEEFGFKVESLPDGTSRVTAVTADGQKIIDDFVQHNDGRRVAVRMDVTYEEATASGEWRAPMVFPKADGGIQVPSYAGGKLPDQAIIQPGSGDGLVQWAEGETQGEAFIPLAPSKRARSLAILAETARRMGMALVGKDDVGSAGRLDPLTAAALSMRGLLSFADGGILDSITAAQQKVAPGLTLTSGHRDEPGSYHAVGQAGDYSNGDGNTDEQLAFANYLADHHRADIAELIYIDPRFGRCIKDGEFVPDSFYAQAGDHTDHVHVAARRKIEAKDIVPELTEQQKKVDAIIAEGRDRGISDKGIKQALGAAYAAGGEDLTADPGHEEFDSARFFDELARTDYENASLDVGAAAMQGDNAEADTATAVDLAGKAFDESIARPPAATDSGGSSITGSPVYVTNWPSGLGPSTSSPSTSSPSSTDPTTNPDGSTTLGSYKFQLFGNGGVEDHSAQIAPAGDMRLWAEPETGGEAYIPLGAAKRGRSTALLRDVAARFGFSLTPYAMGGFGGVGQDGDDGVHTGSWEVAKLGEQGTVPLSTPRRDVPLAVWASGAYRAAAFAAGVAGTVASGWDSTGKFQGFDTSNNDLPDGWGDKLGEVQELLSRIAEAAEQGNPVDVEVAIDPGTRTAELNIKQRGV